MRYSGTNAATTKVLAACAVLASALLGAGCEELSSRQDIQDANKLYSEGRYAKAVELYKQALDRTPTLAIGHHNAGLAYYKLFQPGVETKENVALAEKSAAHFMTYLETEPNDQKVITLLTTIWMDSGQYDKAIGYWTQVLAKEPQNRTVLERLANLNGKAGKFDEARKWHLRRAEIETERGAKVKAYLDLGQMEWGRVQKPDLVDFERLAVADLGLAALQKAEALDPKHALCQSLMASLYQLRQLSHGAHWAKGVETASQKYHQSRFTENMKAQASAAQPAGQPGQAGAPPATPGQTGQPAPAPGAAGTTPPPATK